MNRGIHQSHLSITQILAVCLLLCLIGTTWAQNSSNEFQETREDFLNALGKKPPSTSRTKGLQVKGLRTIKGPIGVIPDNYDELVQNPTARSLILFDFDSDRVKRDSYPILRNLADVLKNDLIDVKLVVAGHTDSVGTDEYNMGLSKRRAQAVKEFLVSAYQIDVNRLIVRWFGERQPFTSNDTEAGRAKNRRVEFIRIQ